MSNENDLAAANEVPMALSLEDPLYIRGFKAGAASRDAEIAELNRRIEYWRNTARKYLVPETKVRKP